MSDAHQPLSASLPGSWELLSRVDVTDSGTQQIEPSLGDDPVALLIYDRAGHFAAQFMKRDRTSVGATDSSGPGANNSRTIGGYDAYFGTYSVDDATNMVTQHLVGSLSAESVGLTLTREMRINGDQLVISLRTTVLGVPVTRTLTWRRVS